MSKQLMLQVHLAGDADSAEVAEATQRLRTVLMQADIERADLVRGASPPSGAKAGEMLTLGALAVSLAPTALTTVLDLLRSWVRRDRRRELELVLDGDVLRLGQASDEQVDRLIEEFLVRARRTGDA
jgi:hypothetical protein